MDDLRLEATKRDILGKKTRFLRRQGITPAHLFGHGIESQALQCDTAQIQKIIARAGMSRVINLKVDDDKQPKSVFIREIQREPVSRQLLHVDLYQVKKGEKIRVDVPIIIIGEAPALKAKGRMLAHGITTLSLESLPEKLPARIEVDISSLEEVEQAILVKNIVLGPEVTVHEDPEQLVVKISEAFVEVEEEAKEVVAEEEAEAGAEALAEGATEQKPDE
ncbi:MAG: 50S ribosomal protein L25 [Chloroflexota bacterium]